MRTMCDHNLVHVTQKVQDLLAYIISSWIQLTKRSQGQYSNCLLKLPHIQTFLPHKHNALSRLQNCTQAVGPWILHGIPVLTNSNATKKQIIGVDGKSGAVIEPRGQRRKDNKRPMWRREVDGMILSGSCGFVVPTTIAQSRYF
jgi:hypothetical protein